MPLACSSCEWQAGCTAGGGDPGTAWRRWLVRDRRVRAVVGDHRSVGKPLQTTRRLSGPVQWQTPPALPSSETRDDRPAGYGKTDVGMERNARLLVGLVVDLSSGDIALDRLDALDRAGLALVGLAGRDHLPFVATKLRRNCWRIQSARCASRKPRAWDAPSGRPGWAEPTARRAWAGTVVVLRTTATNRCLGHLGGMAGEDDRAPACWRRYPAWAMGEAPPRRHEPRRQDCGGGGAAGAEPPSARLRSRVAEAR
jgi:hypothetical protein